LFIDFELPDTTGNFLLRRSDGGVNVNKFLLVGDFGFNPVFPTNFPPGATADSRALSDAFRKVRSTQISMSGMTFLGELREAIHMIKRPASSLRKGISTYVMNARKRTRGISPKKVSGVLSGLWLEAQFGWKPLMHDIEDGMKAYSKCVFDNPKIRVKGVGGESTQTDTFGPSIQGPWNWHVFDVKTFTRYETGVEYTVGLKSTRAGGADVARQWSKRFGFTAEEFIPTIWELIPWSFFVDYFSNVGDVLSAATTDTSSVIWVSKMTKSVGTYESTYTPNISASQTAMGSLGRGGSSSGSWTCSAICTRYDRVSSSLTVPHFTVSCPGSGSLKWLNIAALTGLRRL
jgi:hypothetical protein